MNSTPDTKDVLMARADEQLARAYEQIARADEQLARVSRARCRTRSFGRIRPAATAWEASAAWPHRPAVGGVYRRHRRRRLRFDWRPLGAAAHFNAILAVEKPAVSCATRSIARSSDHGGGSAAASSTDVPHWTAGRRYGCLGGFRPDTVAAEDDERYRKSRASDGTA
jgi:hypothetical protein